MIVSADSQAQVETASTPVIQCSILDRESKEYVDSLKKTEEFHEDNRVKALERATRLWKPGRLLLYSFIQLGWLVRDGKIHENAFSSEETRERRDMDLCFFQSLMLNNTLRVEESAACQIKRSAIDDEKFWGTRFEDAQIGLCFLERSDTTKPVYPTEDLIPEHQLLVQTVLRVRKEYQQQILILWKKKRHKKGNEDFVEAVIDNMNTGCDYAETVLNMLKSFWFMESWEGEPTTGFVGNRFHDFVISEVFHLQRPPENIFNIENGPESEAVSSLLQWLLLSSWSSRNGDSLRTNQSALEYVKLVIGDSVELLFWYQEIYFSESSVHEELQVTTAVWHLWMHKIKIGSCVVLLLKRWFKTWESLLLCWFINGVCLQQDDALEVECFVLGAGVFKVAT